MSVLMHASNEWSNRPADQRFKSLEDLHSAITNFRDIAFEAPKVNLSKMTVAAALRNGVTGSIKLLPSSTAIEITDAEYTTVADAVNPNPDSFVEPVLIGESGKAAAFTNFSFGSLARRIGAPAAYLRTLPTSLAVQNMNHGLANKIESGEDTNLLFTKNGGLTLRAAVSDKYTRIWNSDITKRLLRLTEQSPEWQPAPAAFDGSRGLYASDRDMFAFLVDNERRIFERGPEGGLGRGFFVWNSEVGDKSFGVTTFLYEYVCGNHRVWGASGITELRIPHIGNADERAFSKLTVELRKYADSSTADTELKITQQRNMILGATKDEVLDKVLGLRVPTVTKALATLAYERAVEREDRYGNPHSVWGFTGGLTELATEKSYTEDRVAIEKAAGKIAQIAF